MKVYENEELKFPTVAVMGFFDGVHRGHRALIEKAKQTAAETGLRPLVFTFNVHPAEILGKNIKYITTNVEKTYIFEKTGVDGVYFQTADRDFLSMSAENFFKTVIVDKLGASHVIIGENYTFGKNKSATAADMAAFCNACKIGCDIIPSVYNEKGSVISSSGIRESIFCGNIEAANEMLGHRFFIKNTIEHGRGDGRKMGVPTINTKVEPGKILPPLGVYATTTIIGDEKFKSITNIGYAPTFGENPITVETNILGFDEIIYGENPAIEFLTKIRGEKKFPSPDELAGQIKLDIKRREKLEF